MPITNYHIVCRGTNGEYYDFNDSLVNPVKITGDFVSASSVIYEILPRGLLNSVSSGNTVVYLASLDYDANKLLKDSLGFTEVEEYFPLYKKPSELVQSADGSTLEIQYFDVTIPKSLDDALKNLSIHQQCAG